VIHRPEYGDFSPQASKSDVIFDPELKKMVNALEMKIMELEKFQMSNLASNSHSLSGRTSVLNANETSNVRRDKELQKRLVSAASLMMDYDVKTAQWKASLMTKLRCIHSYRGGYYLYHTRKAAGCSQSFRCNVAETSIAIGTTVREVLLKAADYYHIRHFETEGISLDHRFLELPGLLSIITFRDPINRIMSLYW
jgi:hypothetical protein